MSAPSSKRRVVIAGGAGFLGSHLCDRFLADGYDVVCVDDLSSGRLQNIAHLRERPGFDFRFRDVCDGVDVSGRVDAVLHFASPASPPDYLTRPLETLRAGSLGTQALLELARLKDARFLLASTSETYGDPLVHPQTESYWGNVNPVGPRSVYDEAKRYAEALTAAYRRTHGVDTKIIRIFNTYGERMRPDDGRAVPTFSMQALDHVALTVAGDGSQTRSLCYVADLVEGIVRMLASDQAGPVNLGNPHELSMLDLALTIRDLVSSTSPVTFVGRPVDDPMVRRPDITLARTALGWEPTMPLREGLLRTIAYFASLPDEEPAGAQDPAEAELAQNRGGRWW